MHALSSPVRSQQKPPLELVEVVAVDPQIAVTRLPAQHTPTAEMVHTHVGNGDGALLSRAICAESWRRGRRQAV